MSGQTDASWSCWMNTLQNMVYVITSGFLLSLLEAVSSELLLLLEEVAVEAFVLMDAILGRHGVSCLDQ